MTGGRDGSSTLKLQAFSPLSDPYPRPYLATAVLVRVCQAASGQRGKTHGRGTQAAKRARFRFLLFLKDAYMMQGRDQYLKQTNPLAVLRSENDRLKRNAVTAAQNESIHKKNTGYLQTENLKLQEQLLASQERVCELQKRLLSLREIVNSA
jgi:hypothetical protein